LWQQYDNADNLLFREADLRDPDRSDLFRELARSADPTTVALTSAVREALRNRLESARRPEEILAESPPGPPPLRPRRPATVVPPGVPKNVARGKSTPSVWSRERLRLAPISVWIAAGVVAAAVLVGGVAGAVHLAARERPSTLASGPTPTENEKPVAAGRHSTSPERSRPISTETANRDPSDSSKDVLTGKIPADQTSGESKPQVPAEAGPEVKTPETTPAVPDAENVAVTLFAQDVVDLINKLQDPEAKKAITDYAEALLKAKENEDTHKLDANKKLLADLAEVQSNVSKANQLDEALLIRDIRKAIENGNDPRAGIEIITALYGQNISWLNVTDRVRKAVGNKDVWSTTVRTRDWGEPAPGFTGPRTMLIRCRVNGKITLQLNYENK
jgi:hypothetical protein